MDEFLFKGISLYRYIISPNATDNTCHKFPNCAPYWLTSPSGLINITKPSQDLMGAPAPFFFSLPFFLEADPYYLDSVDFLPPNNVPIEDLHQTRIDVEPVLHPPSLLKF